MADNKSKAASDFFHIHRQGFLLKEPPRGMRKRLVRYWFVLFESREQLAFLFFHNEDHFLERKKNEGFFRIDDATSINVLPEHLGRKNAFSICTPRNTYKIVSESRYELHQWLVALNETMEKFTKRKEEEKERKARRRSVRQRANSTSADAMSTSTSASTYPRRRPTRKAPPVPKTKAEGEGGFTPEHQLNSENHTEAEEGATNLEDIMANLMASTQELQAAMEYSMTEEEPHSFTGSPEPPVTPTTPTEPPSVPSNIATPVPNSQETTTPDSMVNGVDTKKEELTRSLDDLTEKSSIQVTSNTGSGKRKSTKKRVGSMKAMRRSVSPPNVPPPPPPNFDDEAQKRRRTPPTPPTDATDGSPPQPATQQKYLKVMDSFNDIGDELNQIASELTIKENGTPKAKPPTPARVSSLSQQPDKPSSKPSSEVGDYLDEAFERQDILEDERSESMEVLVDTGKTESSPGILRKGKERTGERGQVTFQDTTSQAYEPRIDQEAVPTSVADAKLKLFGEKDATRFSKTVIQNQNQALNTNNNNGDQTTQPTESSQSTTSLPTLSNAEDLLHSIESALQTTSYMEHQKLTEETEENAYESPWDNKAVARYGLPSSDRGGVSFSADLGRKGRSLERKRRSAGSPQHAVTSPDHAPSSSRSVENILGRSSTFSTSHSLSRPSHRSVSMASDLERQQLQQWLKREQNGFGKKFPPPIAPKKAQTNYNTLPNWSQLKSSGTQVSYNSSMQSTVYRSLV